MGFTNITPPVLGDPTRLQAFAIPVINDLNYLNGVLQIAKGTGIINGSFEIDAAPNANLAPTEWTLALAAGNSCAIINATGSPTDVHDGAQSFQAVTPGSVSGGVVMTTGDFYSIGEQASLLFEWWWVFTLATVTNEVYVVWYDGTQSLLSTSTLYNASTGNPTSWTYATVGIQAPTGARFFKLQFSLLNSTTAGTGYLDGVTFRISDNPRFLTFTTPGAQSFDPNPGIAFLKCKVLGGGGGNATSANAGSNGGVSWVGNNTIEAPGGKGNGIGSTPPAITDAIGSNYIQYGSNAGGGKGYQSHAYYFANSLTGAGGMDNTSGEIGTGGTGPWVEYIIPIGLTPVAVQVGAGGSGGTGPSGDGYSGVVIIEEIPA